MRRIFEWVGGFALIAFSFYFTDKVSLLVASKSDLMQEIKAVSSIYETEAEDATINEQDNTIVPGKFGRTVNSQESYLEMHDFGSFNENYLVFDYIKPEKSLEDHKDKFITSGNPEFRRVGFIVIDNDEVESYFNSDGVQYDKVVREYDSFDENVELINGAEEKREFMTIDTKVKNAARICVKNASNIDLCKKYKYYLIDSNLELTSSNLIEIKNNVGPGSIILVTSGAKVEDVKLIKNEIEYKDLDIVHISKLISEKESLQ